MKRILCAILIVCSLFSCSTDVNTTPDISITPGGLFVAANETQMLGVWVYGGECTRIMFYRKNGTMYSVDGFTTNGEWPNYFYSNSTFQMRVTFNDDATAFLADYSGELSGNSLGYYPEIVTETFNGIGQKFTLTNEPIDANADGIPDIMQ